jgi:hypothetical protein
MSSPSSRPMKKESQESIFLTEWLALGRPFNQLSISSSCGSRCIFCLNDLNPFPVERGSFRDLEDIKLQLSLMEPHPYPIRMGDSLPGRIAEGDAFLHPRFFEILRLVRRKFITNTLCVTTNGSLLDKSFLKGLSPFRPMEITLSMHSTRPELWARISRTEEKDAKRAIRALKLIREYHLDLMGAIVPLPNVVGWDDIERTLDRFVSGGAKGVILYWPGFSNRTPPHRLPQVECGLEEFMDFAYRMKSKQRITLWAYPDMRCRLDVAAGKILARTLRSNMKNAGGPYRHVLWLASEAAFDRLQKDVDEKAASAGNTHSVMPARNRTYGGNIIVSGLLLVEDFITAGREAMARWPDLDLILIPRMPFDSLCRDLQKTPAFKISDELNLPVWLVHESLGDADPLLGPTLMAPLASPGKSIKRGFQGGFVR